MSELTPVTPSCVGVGKLVSVLVSVVDHATPNLLLHTQLEMEAGVGIEPTHRSFADFRLPTWQTRPPESGLKLPRASGERKISHCRRPLLPL